MKEKLLKFIKQFITENGYAPTVREIASGVGECAPSTVLSSLQALRLEGYIEYKDRMPRTIVVLEKGRAV